MSLLSNCRVSPQIAVSDMARAEQFYGQRLGLVKTGEQHDASRGYACGNGTSLYVYAAPARAGRTSATMARWDVDDIEQAVDELTARSVAFEQYEEPLKTNAKGILDTGYGKVAWFRDPDGNTFALEQIQA